MKDNANRTVGWEEKLYPLIMQSTYLGVGLGIFTLFVRQE